MSDGSLDFQKITKLNNHVVSNGSRRLANPVSGPKKEINSPVLGANAVHIQAKRVPDLKGSKIHSVSSVRSVTSNQVQMKTIPNESQLKSKPGTLQSRIAASRKPCGEEKKNGSVNDAGFETLEKTSLTAERLADRKGNKAAVAIRITEDDPVVDKSVLILENKTILGPVVRKSELTEDTTSTSCEVGRRERFMLVSKHPCVVLPSTLSAGEVDNSSQCRPYTHPNSYEVLYANKEAFISSLIDSI